MTQDIMKVVDKRNDAETTTNIQLVPQEFQEVPGPLEKDIETVSVKNVRIGEIHRFSIIPDYFSECTICMPVIINQNGVYHCIENWGMVESALSNNEEFIESRIVTPANASDCDTVMRKFASRIYKV